MTIMMCAKLFLFVVQRPSTKKNVKFSYETHASQRVLCTRGPNGPQTTLCYEYNNIIFTFIILLYQHTNLTWVGGPV